MEHSVNDSEVRARCVRDATSKSVLDAAFLCYYYNCFTKNWGPGMKPTDIDLAEVFPSLAAGTRLDALMRSARLFDDANRPAMARLGYREVESTYDEALARFRDDNPGFSEESYDLALQAAMVNNR